MVPGLLPGLALLPAPAGRAAAVVEATLEVRRGDPHPGEAELIAAVEVAAVGELVPAQHPPLRRASARRGGSRSVFPRPMTVTSRVRPKTLAPSMLMSTAMRPSGTGGWRARYSEPRRPCSSAATAAKRMLRLGAFSSAAYARGHGEHPRHSRGIVLGPVVDGVFARRGIGLRCRGGRGARCRARPPRKARIAAGEQAEHVRGAGALDAAVEGGARDAQRHGLEVARFAERTSSSRSARRAPTSLRQASSVTQPRRGTRRSLPGTEYCGPVQELRTTCHG